MSVVCTFVYILSIIVLSGSVRYSDDDEIFLGDDAHYIKECYDGTGYVRVDPTEKDEHRSMLDRDPPKFLKGFKNPCWIECMPVDKSTVYPEDSRYWEYVPFLHYKENLQRLRDEAAVSRRNWRLRCLPQFYLIGWLKCGSSDLFSRLVTHPDIITMTAKEVRFWSGDSIARNGVYALERYLDVADIPAQQILETMRYNLTAQQFYHPFIFGDGTPSDIFVNSAWVEYTIEELQAVTERGDNDDDVTYMWTPKYISHLQPNAKFLVIIRNPVSMTYSAYKFFARSDAELSVEHFHMCVVKSIEAYRDCEERHSASFCSYTEPRGFNFEEDLVFCHIVLKSIQYGRYFSYIMDWLKYFPLDQFYIVQMERYSRHQKTTIEDIWNFLEVEPLESTKARHLGHSAERVNSASISIGSMLVKTEKLLREYFAPHNIRLAKLLNDPVYLQWNN